MRGTQKKSNAKRHSAPYFSGLFAAVLVVSGCGGGGGGGSASSNSAAAGDAGSSGAMGGNNSSTTFAASDNSRQGQMIPNRYIVVSNKSAGSGPFANLTDLLTYVQTTLGGTVDTVFENSITGFVVNMDDTLAPLLEADPRVDYLEQDQWVNIGGVQSNATWGLDRVDQSALPLDQTYSYESDGANVHTYVIDTGVRSTHDEFSGRMGNGISYAPASGGFLFGGGGTDSSTEDCNGHGTHVAGTVAGTTYGVAKRAIVHPVRVLGCTGSGANSGVIAGVDWVAANHIKPAVANMSLGGGNSTALDDAVRGAIEAGVTFVVAAGNDNSNACSGSPNRIAEAITVGSTTDNDERSSFSNRGECVDIFAPGSNITSAWFNGDSSTNSISGTSMASPHVAGVAAQILSRTPNASPAVVFNQLLASAASNRLSNLGNGSPNLLMQVAQDTGAPIDRAPLASFVFVCDELACDFDASESTDDNGITSYSWAFGDGAAGNGETVGHTYAADGSYNATLTVTDAAGQSSSRSQTVTASAAAGGGVDPCPGCQSTNGNLNDTNSVAYFPSAQGFSAGAGNFRGVLSGPANTDFDLYLERLEGFFIFTSWRVVASSESDGSSESIDFEGNTAGTYRWRIRSFEGGGAYTLQTDTP